MAREWKPGDVAMLKFRNNERAIGVRHGFDQTPGWSHSASFGGGSAYDSIGGFEARPLVVIDPDDRGQVERLAVLVFSTSHQSIAVVELADALREFADLKPPKPEEPSGLGAVVRDSDNSLYVQHAGVDRRTWCGPDGIGRRWSEIDAVEVLAEGYNQGADEPLADWERALLRGQS